MENVHLAVEEDDLYTGYNDYNPTFDSDVSYILLELASTNLFASVCNLKLTTKSPCEIHKVFDVDI